MRAGSRPAQARCRCCAARRTAAEAVAGVVVIHRLARLVTEATLQLQGAKSKSLTDSNRCMCDLSSFD